MGTRRQGDKVISSRRSEQREADDEIRTFFANHPKSLRLYQAVAPMAAKVGPVERRVTKSQIAFHHKHGFAFFWRPDQYLHGSHAPLVLSIALRRRDKSKRWKEIAEPAPGHYMHHLELFDVKELDATVQRWLQEAYDAAY